MACACRSAISIRTKDDVSTVGEELVVRAGEYRILGKDSNWVVLTGNSYVSMWPRANFGAHGHRTRRRYRLVVNDISSIELNRTVHVEGSVDFDSSVSKEPEAVSNTQLCSTNSET